MSTTVEARRRGRPVRGRRRPAGVAVALVALVLALVGCGGDDNAADVVPSTEPSTSVPPTTADPTTTEAPTTTTRPLSEVVTDVPISIELAQLIPPFAGEAELGEDSRFDIRSCDGLLLGALPDAQAEATFTTADDVTQVGVYRFADGAGEVFLEDYTDALLACSGGEAYEEVLLGELAYGFPYDTETSDGFFLSVLSDDVVWVVQRRTTDGVARFTEEELALLAQVTG